MNGAEAFGSTTLRRIEWLTLALGGLGAAWAAWRWGWRGGVGLALGAGLSWLNFRWLKASVQEFGRAATAQAGSSDVRVSKGAYLKFFGRFVLLLGAVYVILTRSWLPAIPVLAGLFASAAAVVLGLVYELLFSGVRLNASGRS
jgi:hypothetical protein